MPRSFRTIVFAVLTLTCAVTQGRQAEDSSSGDASGRSAPGEQDPSYEEQKKKAEEALDSGLPEEPPRRLTRAELQRQLDFLDSELENLLVKIGDGPPTSEQAAKEHALVKQLTDLRAQLAQIEAEQKAAPHDRGFAARWKRVGVSLQDATRYDVKDGFFRIEIGIKLQADFTSGTEHGSLATDIGSIETGVDVRRGRIFSRGRLFRVMDYKLEWDFAVDSGIKDAYLEGAKFVKHFRWRVGNFLEPFSMARQTGSNHLGFLEWGLPSAALAPGRAAGLMLLHTEAKERVFWAVSATTDSRDEDSKVDSKLTLTGRVTGLPLFRDKGRRLIHVGASYSLRKPTGGEARYSARPEARFAPFFVDTGSIPTDRVNLLAVEGAMVWGRWWTQAEWIRTDLHLDEASDAWFHGAYVEAGFFLTGESRTYHRIKGNFGRVTPNRLFHGGNPFKRDSNGGALEITGRVSGLDLNSRTINGGEMSDLSLGMNWYLNQQVRFMLNLIHSDVRESGSADIVLVRFQYNP